MPQHLSRRSAAHRPFVVIVVLLQLSVGASLVWLARGTPDPPGQNTFAGARVLVRQGAYGDPYAPRFGTHQYRCQDNRGREVFLITTPDVLDVAYATMGTPPYITVGFGFVALPVDVQAFVYLHECAHLALGHPGQSEFHSNSDADCWAASVMHQEGRLTQTLFQALERLVGTARSHMIQACDPEQWWAVGAP